MPPKGPADSRKARKSTAGKPSSKASTTTKPVSTTRGSRVLEVSDEENAAPSKRRRGAAAEVDELESEAGSDSDAVAATLTAGSAKKSSRKSGTTASATRASASPAKKTSAGRQSLKGPAAASPAKAIKGTPAASSAGKKKPASTTARKSATKKQAERKRSTTTASSDDDDDDDTPTTRSRSARGYTWAAEVVTIPAEEIIEKLSYHSSIKTEIEADSDADDDEPYVRFKRDEMIYILPDPHTLPPLSEEIEPQGLEDEDFWCARVLDCCALDQGPDNPPLGLLRIAWYYTPDQLTALPDALIPEYEKKIRRYRWKDYEMIASDHIDFVGVDTFAGYPKGRITAQVMMHGLEVTDVERMKAPAKRAKSKKLKRMTGFDQKNGKKGAGPEAYLCKLSKETPEERRKRISREARREKKRRESRAAAASDDDEGADEEQ